MQVCLESRKYKWDFVVADVSRPLLGADFLRANSLLVDRKGKHLVDAGTYFSTPLHKAKESSPHLDAISISTDKYAKLLTEFPEITVPNFSKTTTKHRTSPRKAPQRWLEMQGF